jgi:hypothetical protein
MGLPGTGRRVRVVRQPERAEPVEAPEPVREDAPAEQPAEPVKAGA